ncbi:hypothetical protein BH23GEM9_BH23GEM9_17720 [soil metagenome]
MNPARPQVAVEQYHTTLYVADLSAAIKFYTERLGFELAFTWGDPAEMAGVNLDCTQIFLEVGTPAPQGCSLYFVIDNADDFHAFHEGNGVEIVEALGERPWEFRDYTVRDLNGYLFTFGHRVPGGLPSN